MFRDCEVEFGRIEIIIMVSRKNMRKIEYEGTSYSLFGIVQPCAIGYNCTNKSQFID